MLMSPEPGPKRMAKAIAPEPMAPVRSRTARPHPARWLESLPRDAEGVCRTSPPSSMLIDAARHLRRAEQRCASTTAGPRSPAAAGARHHVHRIAARINPSIAKPKQHQDDTRDRPLPSGATRRLAVGRRCDASATRRRASRQASPATSEPGRHEQVNRGEHCDADITPGQMHRNERSSSAARTASRQFGDQRQVSDTARARSHSGPRSGRSRERRAAQVRRQEAISIATRATPRSPARPAPGPPAMSGAGRRAPHPNRVMPDPRPIAGRRRPGLASQQTSRRQHAEDPFDRSIRAPATTGAGASVPAPKL